MSMEVDDKVILGGFTALSGAVSYLWHHSTKAERECRDELMRVWKELANMRRAPAKSPSGRRTILPDNSK
jgi:hypothetical protein